MTKSELQKLIRQEVINIVKPELLRMVKPLVQEAVAGALANLLAEGIIKGPPPPTTQKKILAPNVPLKSAPRTNTFDKRDLAEQLGYGHIDAIGDPTSIVGNILTETAHEMRRGGGSPEVESVLDRVDQFGDALYPETVEAITRDYSELMAAMNKRGKLNG